MASNSTPVAHNHTRIQMDMVRDLYIIPNAHPGRQGDLYTKLDIFADYSPVMNACFRFRLRMKFPQQTGKGKLWAGNNNLGNRNVYRFLHQHSGNRGPLQCIEKLFFTEESNMSFLRLLNITDS